MVEKHEILLPEPWEHIEYIRDESRNILESHLGSGLNQEDLTDEDVQKETWGQEFTTRPRSHRAMVVMWRRWARIRNTENLQEVLLRLQSFDGHTQFVTSIAFVHNNDARELTGADLRHFPLAAVAAAYTYDEQAGTANLKTFFELMGNPDAMFDPLTPLPKADSSKRFSALVANQYQALEKQHPDKNIAKLMQELNDKSLPTIQRWITQARKNGFLPPANLRK